VTRINSLLDRGDVAGAAPLVAAWHEILAALGLEVRSDAGDVPEEVLEMARQRDAARAAKDWSTADGLRDRIAAAGFVAEDGPEGTIVRPS
jgi:cysteinyl-tRNA synthetase